MRQIATSDPSAGLFSELFNQYREQVDKLFALIGTNPGAKFGPLDVLASELSNQAPTPEHRQSLAESLKPMLACQDANVHYSLPQNIVDAMVPAPFSYAFAFNENVGVCLNLIADAEIELDARGKPIAKEWTIDATVTSRLRVSPSAPWETIQSRRWETEKRTSHMVKDIWSVIGPAFIGNATLIAKNDALKAVTVAKYDASLREQRKKFYRETLGSYFKQMPPFVDSEPLTLGRTSHQLGGAAAILRTFISIGFPQLLQRDDYFHALVHGDLRIVDHPTLASMFAAAEAQELETFKVEVGRRVNELEIRVREALELNRSGRFVDGMLPLMRTIMRLNSLTI